MDKVIFTVKEIIYVDKSTNRAKIKACIDRETKEKVFESRYFQYLECEKYEAKVLNRDSKKIMIEDIELVTSEDNPRFLLYKYGVEKSKIEIFEKIYGSDLETVMKERPYLLVKHRISFNSLKRVIDDYGKNKDLEIAMLAILSDLESMAIGEGHVYITKEEIFERVNLFVSRANFDEALTRLETEKEIIIEKVEGGEFVYLSRLFNAEVKLSEIINRLTSFNKIHKAEDLKIIERLLDSKCEMFLNSQQKNAIKIGITNNLSIITGGAGTGKTTVIKRLIEVINILNADSKIILTAFTGKAVDRASKVTGLEGKTIHRILEERNRNIEADYIILDEASMIETELFNELLSRIKNLDNIRIVLIGDTEQLPAIGAGQVFKDLINSGMIPVIELTEVFRQKENSLINKNAKKIKKGDIGIRFKKGEFEFIESDGKGIAESLILRIERLLKSGVNIEDIQIISAMREGGNGVVELNKKVAESLNPNISRLFNSVAVLDRVIQNKNNYKKKVFNGEVGVVKEVRNIGENLTVIVAFNGKDITYQDREVKELELAFATTIHKMQGSQAKVIILVIGKGQEKMLNRNLLYVAITRAQEQVVVIGEREMLNKAIEMELKQRNSRLICRLNNEIKAKTA